MNRQTSLFLRIGLMLLTLGCGLLPPPPTRAPANTPTLSPTNPATLSPTPTPLTSPTVRKFLISTHSSISSQPIVFGDYVVWAHKAVPKQPLGTYRIDIYAYNLTTKQESVVTSEEAKDAPPLVAGELLVWPHDRGFWGYRLGAEAAEKYRVTHFQALPMELGLGEQGRLSYDRAFFALSDRVLVWSDAEAKDTYDILAYDLERDERLRITDDGHKQTWPAAAGSLMVWADERNDEGDVYAYDLDAQKEYPIVTAPLTQTMPSTDGRSVVWIDGRDGNSDVYAYDLKNRTEFPVVTGHRYRILPRVWGDVIIWMEQDSEGQYIYGYDLRLGEQFLIATEGGSPADPCIWGNVVVWTEYRPEDKLRAIYGAILER